MAEHVNLDRLGGHVSGSLEQLRTRTGAASRVRARLASGAGRDARRNGAARLRIRKGALLGAFAFAATVLVFAVGAWRESRRPLTFVVGAAGAVSSSAPSSGRAGGVGAFLAAPPEADLPIAFSDGTRLRVAAGSRARIGEVTARGARVLVESGVVHATVIHKSDTRWLVDAGPFEVKVTGTRFDVAWQPGEQAIVVSLHEGSVVVSGCGLADGQRVSGGQQLHASCKTGAATVSPLAEDAPATPSSAASAASAALASAAPASAPSSALPSPPVPEPVATAASSLPDAPLPRPARAATVAATASTSTAAIAPADPSAAAAGAPHATASAQASSTATATAAELLARANADRYAGRFDAAAESLDLVRRRFRGSDDAASAAFELGRIAFDGHHDFGAAADWFDTYLRERPSGALAREALGRDIEARHRAGESRRAEQLATRYMALYPDGPHATLARRLATRPGATP